jgi:myo-inositol catabolism protein IolC
MQLGYDRALFVMPFADELGVLSWLGTAAAVPGFIGFAIGRALFWDPLVGVRDCTLSRDAAIARIADRYAEWIQAFKVARAG